MKTVLTATIHEPQPRLLKQLRDYTPLLKLDNEPMIAAYSPETHHRAISVLEDLGYMTVQGGESIQSVYTAALKRSLQLLPDHVFYCDLDRLVHWAKTYPEEYHDTRLMALNYDFLMVGRSPKAFLTHPETQTCTEGIANRIASRIIGFEATEDVVGTCWGLSRPLTQLLALSPELNTYGFYCDWPVTAWRSAKRKTYTEVNGLEWETPDRYEVEIAAQGYAEWLNGFTNPREWKRRCSMLDDLVQTSLRLMAE
jgi:hypothetical protein